LFSNRIDHTAVYWEPDIFSTIFRLYQKTICAAAWAKLNAMSMVIIPKACPVNIAVSTVCRCWHD